MRADNDDLEAIPSFTRRQQTGARSARSLLLTVRGGSVRPAGVPVWTSTLLQVAARLGIEEKAARRLHRVTQPHLQCDRFNCALSVVPPAFSSAWKRSVAEAPDAAAVADDWVLFSVVIPLMSGSPSSSE